MNGRAVLYVGCIWHVSIFQVLRSLYLLRGNRPLRSVQKDKGSKICLAGSNSSSASCTKLMSVSSKRAIMRCATPSVSMTVRFPGAMSMVSTFCILSWSMDVEGLWAMGGAQGRITKATTAGSREKRSTREMAFVMLRSSS